MLPRNLTDTLDRRRSRIPRAAFVLVSVFAVAGFAAACSDSSKVDRTAAQTATRPAATASGTPRYGPPAKYGPPIGSCRDLYSPGIGPVAKALLRRHGQPSECLNLFYTASELECLPVQGLNGQPNGCPNGPRLSQLRMVIWGAVPGVAGGDPRAGFLHCERPPNYQGPYCGLLSAVSEVSRLLANWHFYSFPAADAHPIGYIVWPQAYRCVGNASQLWTFHLDTGAYTPGCTVPPGALISRRLGGWLPSAIEQRPCDAFLDLGNSTLTPLFAQHGSAAFCGLFGGTLLGVVNGSTRADVVGESPQPGLLVCRAPQPQGIAIAEHCGWLNSNGALLAPWDLFLDHWTFVPLPVARGPVDSATFDTAAGIACLTVASQRFTFDIHSLTVRAGCSGP